MRTFLEVREAAVHSRSSGKKIGTVKDLRLYKDGSIAGLECRTGRLFRNGVLITFPDIQVIGPDTVFINRENALQRNGYRDALNVSELVGKPVLTEGGEELGLLENVYFHENRGILLGYEVTNGFFTDLAEGRDVYFTDFPAEIGEEALIVRLNS
ncbi:PRC-barrel domain-containing protein [Bacillus marinisedimentorum]|uniref:PRC-barrel domain-containing protein n=1 Tax=Bacillus marinisedimentorum TaxID=1821260 RepID=UPI000ADD9609|nr:PRC-barrel domain-containing protein [Bacillus marinisedimentorum]